MNKSHIVTAPILSHDLMMAKRFNVKVGDNGRLERRIVANLIAHMERAGWKLHSVYDGEETTKVTEMEEAMSLIFNLDEASLRFYKGSRSNWHGALLVLGNGTDILSDWNYSADDKDGFNAAMSAFDVDALIEACNELDGEAAALVPQLVAALQRLTNEAGNARIFPETIDIARDALEAARVAGVKP